MKALLISLGLLLSSAASADTVVMDSGAYSCAQFKSAIQRYGRIQIVFLGGFSRRQFSRDPDACSWNQDAVGLYIRAKGGENCQLYWACQDKPHHHDK